MSLRPVHRGACITDLLQTRADGRGSERREYRKDSVSHESRTVEVKPPFSGVSNLHPPSRLHVLGIFHNKMFENTYCAPGTRLALTSVMNLHHRKTQSEPFPPGFDDVWEGRRMWWRRP